MSSVRPWLFMAPMAAQAGPQAEWPLHHRAPHYIPSAPLWPSERGCSDIYKAVFAHQAKRAIASADLPTHTPCPRLAALAGRLGWPRPPYCPALPVP